MLLLICNKDFTWGQSPGSSNTPPHIVNVKINNNKMFRREDSRETLSDHLGTDNDHHKKDHTYCKYNI